MAKYVAIAAVCLAAILAVAVGKGEAEQEQLMSLMDMRCLREVQENPLHACRQVLHRQLSDLTSYGYVPFQWSTGLRMQCCQQLQDVSRECRCAAIRRMVRGYELTMPPLGDQDIGYGYGGESGQEYYGEVRPCSQQGSGYSGCGQMGWRQQQGGCGCGCGLRGQQPTTRVRLVKARQYAAQLPRMCSIEPQECNVFSGAGSESC